ncbi:MAG: hypothetical protein V4722_01855 [Bacteroidota bacterium]
MKKIALFLLIATITLAACKGGGKKSMKGDEQVDAADFISFFDDLRLPLLLSDSIFIKKASDSSLIETAVFNQFISDSVFRNEFGKTKPRVYAIGKFNNPEAETYLIFRAAATGKQHVYVAAIDNENKFRAAMPVLSSGGVTGRERLSIDTKLNFTHATDTRASDGSGNTVSQVYAYNNAGLFMVILTDGVPAGTDLPIVDPNDTLPRKSKYAGNYAKDKRNILSIRDAATAQQFRFFIHIEKKEPRFCDGELKGEARMVGTDSATYTSNGDPCSLGFKFSGNSIRITETNCGNRHGMECSFDGTFAKQKTPVKPKEKKPVVKKK